MSWRGVKAAARPIDPETAKLVDLGTGLYMGLCVQCHAPNGQGMQPPDSPKLAPPLDGSPRVLGQKERLVRLLLHGMTGDVDGQQYKGGIMAAMGPQLNDRMLASVLTYVRQAWTNDQPPITPAEVAAIRAASAERKTPWTLAELDHFAAPMLGGSSIEGKPPEPLPWKFYRGRGHEPDLAKPCDTDPKTRGAWMNWGMEPGLWLAVDFGEPTEITAIVLDSGDFNHSPVGWELRTSDDGKQWSEPIASGRGGHRFTTVSCDPVTARFFKITQTQKPDRPEAWLWHVRDFRVYGRPVTAAQPSAVSQK